MSKNKQFTQTSTATSGYWTYTEECPYRLPCGICEKTNRQCPKVWKLEGPYWQYTSTPINYCDSVTLNNQGYQYHDYTVSTGKKK